MTGDGVLCDKFFLDCGIFLAPFSLEVVGKLRGMFARVCLNEHFIAVSKNGYYCTWYYNNINQEYVIKTETPHACITRGTLECLLDELGELFCGGVV